MWRDDSPCFNNCYFMQLDIRAAFKVRWKYIGDEGVTKACFPDRRKILSEAANNSARIEPEAVLATEVKRERGLNFAPASKGWFRGRGLSTDPSRSI